MDWVVSQQLLSQRLLEKQLSEIEAKKRQNEARRLRQIRDVGVDLARMQKSTRDLDDVIEDLSPRHQPRRGSLPCLDSTGGLSSYFQPSLSPRSKRRISCIAAIPAHQINQLEDLSKNRDKKTNSMTQDKDKQSGKMEQKGSNSNTGTVGQRRNSKPGEVTSNTSVSGKGKISSTGKTTNSDLADPRSPRLTGRRGSGGGSCSPRKKDSQMENHNVTAVYVHQDTARAGDQYTDDLSEEEAHSMFVSTRNRRRASEPALGGYYIQGLQNKAMDEIPAFLQQTVIENEELKKSIETNLPSDLVAETEEEETEIKSEDVGKEKNGRESWSTSKLGGKLTAIRETDQDGDDVINDTSQMNRRGSTDSKASSGTRDSSPGKSNSTASRQRRKSDGDVLKFNTIWKLRSADRAQSGKGKALGGLSLADNYDDDDDDDDEQDEIWKAVRKCRYIRGYEPPEMKEPQDLGEFVFGHRNPQSTPPEQ